MGTNEIDIALANLAQNNANKRYICEELLFFYALWEKEKHTDKWFTARFGRKQENVWFLFRVCSLSYAKNCENNLFQIFDTWKYKETFGNCQRTELSFMFQPHPINLCYYNCYNACNYWEFFQWSDALNLGWATLNTIAKIIENSEALSAYAAIIRTSVQMLIKDADYFNTMHIVSPKCLTGEPAGLWDLKFNG